MPEDLKLSQIGSSQLPPPFRGLHSPGVRKHCQIIFACYFRKSSITTTTIPTVSNACVTISGLLNLKVIADKWTTAQSTVVTKICSSLCSCSTIHELSVFHAGECAAISQNVVKRLTNPNRVNCFFDVMGQSDIYLCKAFYWAFYSYVYTIMLRVQGTVKGNGEERRVLV